MRVGRASRATGTWAPDHQRRSGGCCYRLCVAPYKTWRGARSSVVAAERAPLVRPLRLQSGVPPRVLLDNRPALQRHRLELGLGWRQHARLEVRVLLCGAVGRGAQTQDMVACMRAVYAWERVAGAFALSSLMNFSLRLVCVSPSMRLMNSPVVDMRGCDSSILRSRERRTPRAGFSASNAQAPRLDVWSSRWFLPPPLSRERRKGGQGRGCTSLASPRQCRRRGNVARQRVSGRTFFSGSTKKLLYFFFDPTGREPP